MNVENSVESVNKVDCVAIYRVFKVGKMSSFQHFVENYQQNKLFNKTCQGGMMPYLKQILMRFSTF